ncbi:MAG: GNAT family N-acetyltransferase [Candidatus Gracilibacteria bacterium]
MQLIATKKPRKKDVEFIKDNLKKYNQKFTGPDNHQELAVFLKDENDQIKGGLTGGTYWDWLYIDALWIDESMRHKGYGKQLLELAENEAKARGCNNAHLDTHDFQALNFYQKNGYTICGQLDYLPKGHTRYLLKKTLIAPN